MKNLKIRSKLFILVGMLIVGLIALGMTSLSFMSKINGSSTTGGELAAVHHSSGRVKYPDIGLPHQ